LRSETFVSELISLEMADEKLPSSNGSTPLHTEHAGHGVGPNGTHSHAHAEHGPLIDHHIAQDDAVEQSPELTWSRIRHFMREPFSEFFGVFILILFGDGVVAQVVLSNGTKGDYQSISWGWGLGVMLGVYTGGISGAHLNPAVTFANCVFRRFPWRKFPIYMLAQTLGAMCASGEWPVL
jgi:aquaglyceroporin related protein